MAQPIAGLPWWMPAWFWRATRTAWFASVAMGIAGYEMAALINDVTAMVPWWARLIAGVSGGLMVRLGIRLERHKIESRADGD